MVNYMNKVSIEKVSVDGLGKFKKAYLVGDLIVTDSNGTPLGIEVSAVEMDVFYYRQGDVCYRVKTTGYGWTCFDQDLAKCLLDGLSLEDSIDVLRI